MNIFKTRRAAQESAQQLDVGPCLHTREGFVGDVCATLRPNSVHEFTNVVGPHAPYRMELKTMRFPDREDPSGMPRELLKGRTGLAISASGLAAPTPYACKNVEADELHFVQEGELDFVTAFGTLRAEAGDFVYIARTAAYRLEPVAGATLRLIVELPERLRLAPSQPFGVVNRAHDVIFPDVTKTSTRDGAFELRLKSFDGVTRYTTKSDPLAMKQYLGGPIPVWKLNLKNIAQQTTTSGMCPPSQFAETQSRNSLFFTLSARQVARPPHHENADYDEVILYVGGPGAWGGIHNPGILTWCPKGAMHWGPGEDVPEGYSAWLLECADTLRLSKGVEETAVLMETGDYNALQ